MYDFIKLIGKKSELQKNKIVENNDDGILYWITG